MPNADELKRQAAAAAIDLVENGMTLGLGTGSTAARFIAMLGASGKRVRGVATSEETRGLAVAAGLDVVEPDEATVIDLAVDGADEIDPRGDCVKGGGGALLREKIVAAAARKFVVIADASKAVSQLGAFPLPVEISRFSWALTVRRIRETIGANGKQAKISIRYRDGAPVMTDGGNYIVDCALGRIDDAQSLDAALRGAPGVLATGLFVGLCRQALIAGPSGVESKSFAWRRV